MATVKSITERYIELLNEPDFRGKVYTTPIAIIATQVKGQIFVFNQKPKEDPHYAGTYLKVEDETGKFFFPIYSEYQIQAAKGLIPLWDIVVFEAIGAVPKFGISKGKRKMYAYPHPFEEKNLGNPDFIALG